MGPRTGDLVRARTDERDATVVEGVLQLSFVPAWNYMQVLVLDDEGPKHVDPDSIEVLKAGVILPEDLERDDLRDDPDWHPIRDLAEAQASGLVHPARDYAGATWADLFARGDRLVQPLVDSGWVVTDRHAEPAHGPTQGVMYSLERASELIDVQNFEDGTVDVYPGGDNPDQTDDAEPTEPLFTVNTDAEAQSEFSARGWSERRE
jgi:hypothetical protein